MKVMMQNKEYERKGDNLYLKEGKYYRLFADCITDNGCWLINPYLQELKDIEISTGKDVYGPEIIKLECCGTAPSELIFLSSSIVKVIM